VTTSDPDTPLVTLESDKATMDVPSAAAGTIASLLVKTATKCRRARIIATLVTAGTGTGHAPGDGR
jgi:pyruvate/2-oxoglutarate dehydrogenase complex dihydrolipoamide acyltransferase (E2) component